MSMTWQSIGDAVQLEVNSDTCTSPCSHNAINLMDKHSDRRGWGMICGPVEVGCWDSAFVQFCIFAFHHKASLSLHRWQA